MRKIDPALVVVLAGVSAALHVGKLAPALPVLSRSLGITLVQAGFLLSLVQLAGMTLGLVAGAAADAAGLKRTMLAGLLILSIASLLGGTAHAAAPLMALRCAEGLGFLLVSVTGPGLIRRLVEPARMSVRLGLWGAYMPVGTAMALLFGPVTIAGIGWPGWWWLLGLVSLAMAAWLWRAVPVIASGAGAVGGDHQGWLHRLQRTLSSRGPWLVALTFAVYSSQWLAVIGFLPTVYAQAGVGSALAGVATALAAAANTVGNIASGRMLRVGARAESLLYTGFTVMAFGAFVAFAPWWSGVPGPLPAAARYAAVLLFSGVGGLIPGTLFSLAVRVAPGERTVSTTVGCLQQCSSLGQFAGPPLVAWVAARSGGWQWSWLVTGGCSLAGLALAAATGRLLRRRAIVLETGASAT
jgi:MFS transporter, CP family, cyanate transporter